MYRKDTLTKWAGERVSRRGREKHLTPTDAVTAPGQLRVINRNSTVVPYTDEKIDVARTKAILAVDGNMTVASSRIRERVPELMGQVGAVFRCRFPSGSTFHIKDTQDQVDLALMCGGEHTRGYCDMPANKRGSWT